MMNGFEYTGMDAILAGSFRAAIYCRLSKDDDLDGESASIANQRDMLETYCEKQGWEVVAVYQDDGYTGKLPASIASMPVYSIPFIITVYPHNPDGTRSC